MFFAYEKKKKMKKKMLTERDKKIIHLLISSFDCSQATQQFQAQQKYKMYTIFVSFVAAILANVWFDRLALQETRMYGDARGEPANAVSRHHAT